MVEEELGKKAADEFNSLYVYYSENKIFFEEDLAKEIDALLQNFREVYLQFRFRKSLPEYVSDKRRKQKELDVSIKAWGKLNNNEIPQIKSLIETKFRKIIGIEETKNHTNPARKNN